MCFISLDDHSRVRLQRNNVDYINASLVEVSEANRAYILTQVCGYYCEVLLHGWNCLIFICVDTVGWAFGGDMTCNK